MQARQVPAGLTAFAQQRRGEEPAERVLERGGSRPDWTEVARIVLHLDPDREPDRARRAWKTHLAG